MAFGNFSFGLSLTPWVKRLMIANAAVFFATLVFSPVAMWFAFVPSEVLFRPWTPLTYMFVHAGFLHLLFNMLVLFFFGPPLESRWGSQEFLKYYLVAGLGGAAFSFIFAFHHPVVGASAAIYGVMLAFAMLWPDAPIYIWGIFPIKAKWLVVGLTVLALIGGLGSGGDGVAHFAHLGGFAGGFLYLRLQDPLAQRMARVRKLFDRPRLTIVQGGKPRAPEPPRARRREEERLLDEVDRVLDKISTQGIASLSAEERKVLDEASRRFRRN